MFIVFPCIKSFIYLYHKPRYISLLYKLCHCLGYAFIVFALISRITYTPVMPSGFQFSTLGDLIFLPLPTLVSLFRRVAPQLLVNLPVRLSYICEVFPDSIDKANNLLFLSFFYLIMMLNRKPMIF